MSGATVSYKVSFRKNRPRKEAPRDHSPTIKKQVQTPPPPPHGKSATRLARLLALAHYIERSVESGIIKDYAHAARALGMSRGRMGQVMALLTLSPVVQEMILRGKVRSSERHFRRVSCELLWLQQNNEVEYLLHLDQDFQ